MSDGSSPRLTDDIGSLIVGEWEGLHELEVQTLICLPDGTGEVGTEGMPSSPIIWAWVGDELQITATGELGLVTGVLEKNGTLTLRQPDRPEQGLLTMYRRPSPASDSTAVANP